MIYLAVIGLQAILILVIVIVVRRGKAAKHADESTRHSTMASFENPTYASGISNDQNYASVTVADDYTGNENIEDFYENNKNDSEGYYMDVSGDP